MFELVICRRQVVRGGEDTKLLLDRCKLRFGSLCELESFVLISLFTFRAFLWASPNVHYGVHRQLHALNLKGIANLHRHVAKNHKYVLFKTKAGNMKDWYSTTEVQECKAVVLSSPKPSGWKTWWLGCQTALLDCWDCAKNWSREKTTALIILTASSNKDRMKLIVVGDIQWWNEKPLHPDSIT